MFVLKAITWTFTKPIDAKIGVRMNLCNGDILACVLMSTLHFDELTKEKLVSYMKLHRCTSTDRSTSRRRDDHCPNKFAKFKHFKLYFLRLDCARQA